MNKWELARYLIDAKKCIDSLMYIDENIKKVENLDLKDIIDSKVRLYYINLCIIFDYSFKKPERTMLKKEDEIVNRIYYERDKNNAHKDVDYKKSNIELKTLISDLKNKLQHCLNICKKNLPESITLDYVSYDKNLFRFIHMITPDIENELNKFLYNKNDNDMRQDSFVEMKLFNDTEDMKSITDLQNYAVKMDNGINLKEGVQNRQDACIKINVLFNQNMWLTLKESNSVLQDSDKLFIHLLNEIKKHI